MLSSGLVIPNMHMMHCLQTTRSEFFCHAVFVQESYNGETVVSIADPEQLMHSVVNTSIRTFATEIKAAMQNVLRNLSPWDKNDHRTNVEILM